MIRQLDNHELDRVAGGAWGTVGRIILDALAGVGAGEAWDWITGDDDDQDLASRYNPQAGQQVDTSNGFTRVDQADGTVWIDWDNDGLMDARFWEDPADGDNRIDAAWDETNDRWKNLYIGVSGGGNVPLEVGG